MLKRTLTIAALASLLGACATHSHQLGQGSSPEFLKGEFFHGQQSLLVLESASRRYVTEGFNVHRHQDMTELSKRYRGSEPKHWDRIFAGHDTDHVSYSAVAIAKAPDGAELSCRFAWPSGKAPNGVCLDRTNNEFAVSFD